MYRGDTGRENIFLKLLHSKLTRNIGVHFKTTGTQQACFDELKDKGKHPEISQTKTDSPTFVLPLPPLDIGRVVAWLASQDAFPE